MQRIINFSTVEVNEIMKVAEHKYPANTSHCTDLTTKNSYILFFVTEGNAYVQIENGLYHLSENQVIIVGAQPNIIFYTTDSTANLFSVVFSEKQEQVCTISNQVIKVTDEQQILINSLVHEFENIDFIKKSKPSITHDKEIGDLFNTSCELLYSALTQLLLLFIKKNVLKSIPDFFFKNQEAFLIRQASSQKEKKHPKYNNELVNQIIDFMKNNLSKNFTIEDIAKEFFVGSANLKKIFKKETGISIMTYFKNLKMQTAQMWVRENKLSYTEIASRLGFSSINYFSAAFKNYSGYSPSKYFDSIQPGYVDEVDDVSRILTQRPWST